MRIALCDDISQFRDNRLRDGDWARNFPGGEWITALFSMESSESIEVASGDVALERVKSGKWRAADVHVIQELDARHGRELCALGARPAVLTMFESPLVAFRWNDRLVRRCASFEHFVGPSWAMERIPGLRRAIHHRLRFPCFWRGAERAGTADERVRQAVLVAANKYWRDRPLSRARSVKDALREVRQGLRRSVSPTFAATRSLQLHDERLELVCQLADAGLIEVWGKEWDRLANLPSRWQSRLAPFRSIFRGPCPDKKELLRRYTFAIAYENTQLPGYVTEKVVDAMVAGCVPIYRGAADIGVHVPSSAIIEVTERTQVTDLVATIRSMRDSEVRTVVAAGQGFLATPEGNLHSFEGFARWILSLLRGSGAL